jgi:hypothetical protein
MKLCPIRRRGRTANIEGKRKGAAPKAYGNQRSGRSLAAADQKVAPAKVNRIIRLRWPTQRIAPEIFRCRAEI